MHSKSLQMRVGLFGEVFWKTTVNLASQRISSFQEQCQHVSSKVYYKQTLIDMLWRKLA